MNIENQVAYELNISEKQVVNTIKLLDEGNTIPFIARYRKEVTGNLSDNVLRDLDERVKYLRNLNEKKESVLKIIEEKGKLTPALKKEIEDALTLSEVEDLYRPYKEKKKTRASIAKEKGLDKIANLLKKGKEFDLDALCLSFLDKEKGINSKEDALNGAKDIIAEEISDEARFRKYIKESIFKYGFIEVKEVKKDEHDTYGTYKDFKMKISLLKPHQILAISRGEKEKCLKSSLNYDLEKIKDYILYNYRFNYYLDIYKDIVEDSLKRLILPSVENEIYSELFLKAEDKSLIVFKKNLEALLLYPPLKNKKVLGIDPGFRTGCKYAYVDELSIPHEIGVVFISTHEERKISEAKKELTSLIKKYDIEYIALGNGTGSRESNDVLEEMIKENNLKVKIFIVNESGASVYSASKLAEKEFPELSVEKRSAISLARRIIDPLAELVKIEPKAIGVGQYQHDLNQNRLNDTLKGVVEDSVNKVGVKLNTASISLLSYVSGISSTLANNIYEYRKENGNFKSREELKNVKKMGEKTFEQCAGFLRIDDSLNPLDNTAIHPTNYKEAKKILDLINIDVLKDNLETKEEKLSKLNIDNLIKELNIGKETLLDIIEEIKHPGRDLRDEMELVELNNSVKDIKDLKEGMILNGTIRNIMDFGMFVDLNIHCDGLVHISEVSSSYIKDLNELFKVNDLIKVKVLKVDVEKKRISLTLKGID